MRRHREVMLGYIDEIVGGRLAPGTRLPNEVAVAAAYDISRGVARECLRGLEERGLITVRHGSAMTVNDRAAWDLFNVDVLTAALSGPAAVELLGQYLQCRRIVEVEAAGLAAERATAPELDRMERALAEMERAAGERRAGDRERSYHVADVAFHQALVDAAGNLPLAALVRRLHDALLAARYPLARPAYRKQRAIPEHRAILDAVRSRSADAARAAMTAHLDTVAGYLEDHARRVARAA